MDILDADRSQNVQSIKVLDHHGKTKMELLKKSLRKKKPELSWRSVRNCDKYVFDYALQMPV